MNGAQRDDGRDERGSVGVEAVTQARLQHPERKGVRMEGHANIACLLQSRQPRNLADLCRLLCNWPALDDLARTRNGDKGGGERGRQRKMGMWREEMGKEMGWFTTDAM